MPVHTHAHVHTHERAAMTVLHCMVPQLLQVSLKVTWEAHPAWVPSTKPKPPSFPTLPSLSLSTTDFLCVFQIDSSPEKLPEGKGFHSPLFLQHLDQCWECNGCSANCQWTNEFFPSCPVFYDSSAKKGLWTTRLWVTVKVKKPSSSAHHWTQPFPRWVSHLCFSTVERLLGWNGEETHHL